jgi:hypothetical protein
MHATRYNAMTGPQKQAAEVHIGCIRSRLYPQLMCMQQETRTFQNSGALCNNF